VKKKQATKATHKGTTSIIALSKNNKMGNYYKSVKFKIITNKPIPDASAK
jgi:hypothetical protein